MHEVTEIAGAIFSRLVIVGFAAFGLACLFKGRALRERITALYRSPRITRHMHMRGYLGSMRLVGGAMAVLALTILIVDLLNAAK